MTNGYTKGGLIDKNNLRMDQNEYTVAVKGATNVEELYLYYLPRATSLAFNKKISYVTPIPPKIRVQSFIKIG